MDVMSLLGDDLQGKDKGGGKKGGSTPGPSGVPAAKGKKGKGGKGTKGKGGKNKGTDLPEFPEGSADDATAAAPKGKKGRGKGKRSGKGKVSIDLQDAFPDLEDERRMYGMRMPNNAGAFARSGKVMPTFTPTKPFARSVAATSGPSVPR